MKYFPRNILMSKDIADIPHLSFAIEMSVMAVLNSDKTDIIKQYMDGGAAEEKKQAASVDNNEKMSVLEARMNSMTAQMDQVMESLQQIQQQMNEEQKEESNGLQQQIDELTVSVHKIMSTLNNADDSA